MRDTWVRGRLVAADGVVADGVVHVRDGLVRYAGPSGALGAAEPSSIVAAPRAGYVIPALVDVHNHGGGGASYDEGSRSAVATAAHHHARHGTGTLLASIVTGAPASMLAAVAAAADATERGEVLGIHLEGPFLARARCGAQDPRYLVAPDVRLTRALLDAGRGHVRVMTVAPELPGAGTVVDALLDRGVVPAVGHTEADAALVRRVLARTHEALGRPGLVTHLFNGMPPLHHRRPGPVAGALAAAAAGDALVELVADGVHLDDETVLMVLDLLGAERVVLVTDAMRAAGMPDGTYPLGARLVRVARGVARVGEGAAAPLAGGTAHLLDVVRRCVRAGVDVDAAVGAATRTPARAVGAEDIAGVLAPGRRADLVVTDGDLNAVRVMRAGQWLR